MFIYDAHLLIFSRDRLICRKYFTSLSVRLFLENSNRKRHIIVFAQRFASTKMLDEKVRFLRFLKLNSLLRRFRKSRPRLKKLNICTSKNEKLVILILGHTIVKR